jgi:HemY protein
MRFLFWFLMLAVAAVVVALAVKLNAGYALLVASPYRIEISLNLLLVVLVAAFAGMYFVIRFVSRTIRVPRAVRAWRRQQRVDRARAKQDGAVVALIEGRYGKAQQQALEALAIPGSSGLNAILAARGALDVRDFEGAEAMLNRPEAQVQSLAVPRLMLSAESALEQGQPLEAMRVLDKLRSEAGMHTAALRLELRALEAARRWSDIPPLLDQLVRRKVFDAAQADLLRVSAQSEQLKLLAHDAAGLRDYWSRLSDAVRVHPKIARAAARSFMQLGGEREAADILAQSIDREWDSDLVDLYGECRLGDATGQLEKAEGWLSSHNEDATLLRVLGTLCQRQQLWGKAQTYYEASLGVENTWRAHLALGEMLGRLGREDEANAHFVAALKLATDALRQGRAG